MKKREKERKEGKQEFDINWIQIKKKRKQKRLMQKQRKIPYKIIMKEFLLDSFL